MAGERSTFADADLPDSIARDAEVTTVVSAAVTAQVGPALSAHEAAADPHPGYLTPAEGNAAYSATSHAHAGTYEPAGTVATHAAAGDPHPTYLTGAEGNAAYQPLDSDLTAIAALSTTAFGRGLLALADAAALGGTHTHAGGGASTWTTIVKTSDESKNNSATVADDLLLRATLLANTQYVLRLKAWFLTNATADLKYRMVFTGTTTRVRRRIYRTATTDIAQTVELKTAFDAADVVLSTTGLNPWLEEYIVLQVGASGGEIKLQWGQVTSNAGPTTCLEGSYLEHALS